MQYTVYRFQGLIYIKQYIDYKIQNAVYSIQITRFNIH